MNPKQSSEEKSSLKVDGWPAERTADFDADGYIVNLNNTTDPFHALSLAVRRRDSGSGKGSGLQPEVAAIAPMEFDRGLLDFAYNVAGQVENGIYAAIKKGSIAAALAAAAIPEHTPRADIYDSVLPEVDPGTGQVSTQELLRILSARSATVFDGRTRFEYSIGHIPGALSVAAKPGTPMSAYVSDVAEISRIVPDRIAPIVVYCNGHFCGKSRRLATELSRAGFTNVRRYQLGTPIWRALVGPMEIEAMGMRYFYEKDNTAVFLDARPARDYKMRSAFEARNVPVSEITSAKNDGRLPMDDFNTRVVTFGKEPMDALALALALAQNGFNNVKFYAGAFSDLSYSYRGV